MGDRKGKGMSIGLAEKVRQILTDAGADMVGFGDIGSLPADVRSGLSTGISIACALDPVIAAGIADGPNKAYEAEYHRLNALLDNLAVQAADFLRERGYRAEAISATDVQLDRETLSSQLPHKTVATRSGLGWIGKSALLVTKEYGSAVRIASVLTDADLPVAEPVNTSLCGDCTACVDVCPGHAPTGHAWDVNLSRPDYYDAFACFRKARELSLAGGINHTICGMCIAACPWTKRYISGGIPKEME